jgi:hypothetical protein
MAFYGVLFLWLLWCFMKLWNNSNGERSSRQPILGIVGLIAAAFWPLVTR